MIFKKIKHQNGKRDIYFFGMKIFSYQKKQKDDILSFGTNNQFSIGELVTAQGTVIGSHNTVTIDKQAVLSHINFRIHGDNNKIIIDGNSGLNHLEIYIGNHFPIHNSVIKIGSDCWVGSLKIVIEQDNNKLYIGDKCAISTDVFIRMGEYPHLIFDKESGDYLDKSTVVKIGNHVWLGEKSTILKNASIADGSIVGTRAVVTKKFTEPNVVIAGNPAEVKRKNIYWESDVTRLDKESIFYKNLIQMTGDKHAKND